LPELPLNEFMVFKNMGAYTLSGAVAFNGIPLARCIYVVSQSWDTIKDAFNETPIDEQLVINILKEASSGTCAAAATLALARALSSAAAKHTNEAEIAGRCDELNDKCGGDEATCLDQSTVDCAITC
jgi:hypothetical protein